MTMVEILITMVLVVLIFSAIFQLVQISHRRTLRGGDLTIATIYAADVLELVRGGPYEAFFKDGQTPEKDLDLKTVFSRSSFFKGYDPGKYDSRFDIRVSVGPAGEMPPSKLKQVSVTVTWKERLTGRIPHPVKMVTFYSPSNL
jgi:hypothetical protein